MMLLTSCNMSSGGILGDIVNVIEAICALGNLLLLIYFTNREWNYSNQNEQARRDEEHENVKLERKRLWYNRMVIDRIVERLMSCFDTTDELFVGKKVRENDEKKELINKLRVEHVRCKRLITPCLKMFSSELAKEIVRLLQEYFDILFEEIDKPGWIYSYDFERKMNDKKGQVFKKIYEFDFQNNT